MKAAALSSFGSPDALRLMDVDEPHPGPGQVRIRVKAAGVLPFDVRVRAGGFPPGQTLELPVIPGNEFAGVVDQVGAGVAGVSPGEGVLGFTTLGGYAEYVCVGADQIVPKPERMAWDTAAAFPATAQGAHMAMQEMRVGQGDTVLINGAAGGLGTMSVQLAKLRGAATVIGTASESNHDYLRSLGAIPVAYGDGLVERILEVAPNGVDAALGAARDGLRASVEVTADRDRVVTMIQSVDARELGLREWVGVRSAARLAEMVDLYDQGKLNVHIRATYPLARAADAHRDVGSGHGRGKVVLAVG